MDSLISTLDKVKSIDVTLDEEQSKIYYNNGKFIFNNKELKTCQSFSFLVLYCALIIQFIPDMELINKHIQHQPKSSHNQPKSSQLVFISGETNPLVFLKEFEKCRDSKTDKDKMFKIRHFVDKCHTAEFSKLYFTSDWLTVKSTFLKMYSLPFAQNKKRELDIDFNEETTLRSFVERKLISLSKYTTLPFINQMEMVINDLPSEISSLFIANEKMTVRTEILDFCDSIQDLVELQTSNLEPRNNEESNQPLHRMEVFDFNPESEPEHMILDNEPPNSESEQSSRGAGRGTRGRGRARARTAKKTIP